MLVLKLALRPWRLSPYSQVFSAVAVGFLLLLSGFLIYLQDGLKPVLVRLKKEQVVTAYLGFDVPKEDETKIVDTIRTSLGAQVAAGSDIRLVDSGQFMTNLKSKYPELHKELDDLGQEANGIVPRYVSISGFLDDTALDRVRGVPGIESAESSKDRYQQILGAFSALRWVARLLAAGICLALLTGLIHLARMNAYLHREASVLLRLWGASGTFLNAPGILSGILVGWAGGVIAGVGWATAGTWLVAHIRVLSPLLRDMPPAPSNLGVFLLLAGALIGFVSGVLGLLTARMPAEGRT